MQKLYGAIEAGGTKIVCGVGEHPLKLKSTVFPTESPETVFERITAFFRPYRSELAGIGLASFGPVDLNRESPTYGFVTSTPKPGWTNVDFAGELQRRLNVEMSFDTDVNAAALGEMRFGAARGLSDFIYITIGTGIGGGIVVGGELVHGLVHPELGHMFIAKHPEDNFSGQCPFHGDKCLEGLCAGPAIESRWGLPGKDLDSQHRAWDLQAHYLAEALVSLSCILSPQRVILGGGVMAQAALLGKIRRQFVGSMNGYVQHAKLNEDIDSFIVAPGLGNNAGLAGAWLLTQK